jgi:hypothetical protein
MECSEKSFLKKLQMSDTGSARSASSFNYVSNMNKLYGMLWISYTVGSEQVILYAVNKLYCMQ